MSTSTTVNLYSLEFRNARTYIAAAAFIMGNIFLPQLLHLLPHGGMIWLPIYFFTLVGAYKYGWKVGLLTAILSPVVNSLLFGMPLPAALPAIILKSVMLAVAAGFFAHRYNRVTIPLLLAVVLTSQILGTLGEWAMKGDLFLAAQDFRMGIPGMLLQIFGGYLFIKHLIRK